MCAFADRLGIPLALLYKLTRARARLIMVSVWLSRPKKAIPMRYLRARTRLDAIVTWSSVQGGFAVRNLGVPAEKVHVVPSPVDDRFWSPRAAPVENMICSVGMEARDYATLLEAVEGLDVEVRIAVGTLVFSAGGGAGSTESSEPPFALLKRTFGYRFYRQWAEELSSGRLPGNVRISQQLTPEELRGLYSRARLVVVPLHDVDADCGITTTKEAMAMGKPVVVTRTKGQVDMLEDGKQGVYVPPYDAAALRSAIERLLASPEEADRMGRAGRSLVEARHSMDAHVRYFLALLGEQDTADAVGSPLREPRPS
ncbi:MAG TPA: glycosyltransferase family 4 protein [Acidimicrobiales bacterium]|nr:glycosyltransferase family 4 protein [Acidimicrobiales bacterium]